MCSESRVLSRVFLRLHSWKTEGRRQNKGKEDGAAWGHPIPGPRKSISEIRLPPEGPASHRNVLNTWSFLPPLKLHLSNCF